MIDYNRQSLDGVVRERLYDRIAAIFRGFSWNVVTIKYGAQQQRAFDEPGGERLRAWIDACPNDLYSALMFAAVPRGASDSKTRLATTIHRLQGPFERHRPKARRFQEQGWGNR